MTTREAINSRDFARWDVADLESFREELHERCSRWGETLTDTEYTEYCQVNTELDRRERKETVE